MEFLIVTGLSGAGKSRAVDALEDIGFFCVDNMPPTLISRFAEIAIQSEGKLSKVAVVTDVRGGEMFQGFQAELDTLRELGVAFKLLFLDCSDPVLMTRFKETRRKHPLIEGEKGSVEQAIAHERELLACARQQADYTIDTSHLTAMQLKERIDSLFLDNLSNRMLISCMSFGFKHGGAPSEADLVFDVRCLPNPFYLDELREKTGLDPEVSEYVMKFPQSQELLAKLLDLIDFLVPFYLNEGKSQLIIGFGCTGGKHRSVTFAERVCAHLTGQGRRAAVNHRDIFRA